MSLYTRMRTYFDPELRERKERAVAIARESEARKLATAANADATVLAGNPVIIEVTESIRAWSAHIMPTDNMDAAACFWFRRGLEQAVKVLDDRVSPKTEEN